MSDLNDLKTIIITLPMSVTHARVIVYVPFSQFTKIERFNSFKIKTNGKFSGFHTSRKKKV